MNLNSTEWRHIFKSAKRICSENKVKEFHYKFLHIIIVTKKELCRFGIKQDSDCLYCGKEDSIEHTFINCQFSKAFQRRVIQWFNNLHFTNQHPSVKETTSSHLLSCKQNSVKKTQLHLVVYALLHLHQQTPQ